jgi:hypothetical protein
MCRRKKNLILLAFLFAVFALSVPTANADEKGYKAVVNHLKTKYRAKKVRIPLMWLARLAARIVRPAGVKSFSLTIFEDLRFSRATLDEEMQAALRDSLNEEWTSILRVRSREGDQVYMYMREAGENVKIFLVTINKEGAVVIRAKFNPEKLAEFINNPKIFGISLGDTNSPKAETNKEVTPEVKNEEPKKQN